MTPLASKFALELTKPLADRSDFVRDNGDKVRLLLTGTRFFECTEILGLSGELAGKLTEVWDKRAVDGYAGLMFLPAPSTWLEYKANGTRFATLLVQNPEEDRASCTWWMDFTDEPGDGKLNVAPCGYLRLSSNLIERRDGSVVNAHQARKCRKHLKMDDEPGLVASMANIAQGLLVCINSPHIIGSRQHMPHRKVERELIKTFGPGKFPLQAWTELQLRVAKPIEIDDGEPHEAHLTGRRALHFCRKHIRIRLGKLEYVSAHWRGDAAIGIKQTRYRVTPDRQALQS